MKEIQYVQCRLIFIDQILISVFFLSLHPLHHPSLWVVYIQEKVEDSEDALQCSSVFTQEFNSKSSMSFRCFAEAPQESSIVWPLLVKSKESFLPSQSLSAADVLKHSSLEVLFLFYLLLSHRFTSLHRMPLKEREESPRHSRAFSNLRDHMTFLYQTFLENYEKGKNHHNKGAGIVSNHESCWQISPYRCVYVRWGGCAVCFCTRTPSDPRASPAPPSAWAAAAHTPPSPPT